VVFDDAERDLLLAALYRLRIKHVGDDEKGAQIEALVVKLGGARTRRCSARTVTPMVRHPYPSTQPTTLTKGDCPLRSGKTVRVTWAETDAGQPSGAVDLYQLNTYRSADDNLAGLTSRM
jgi:hypothetical protein